MTRVESSRVDQMSATLKVQAPGTLFHHSDCPLKVHPAGSGHLT